MFPEWEAGNRPNDLYSYLEYSCSVRKRQQLKTDNVTTASSSNGTSLISISETELFHLKSETGGGDIWMAHEKLVSYLKNHFSNFATSNYICCQHFPSAEWHLICIIRMTSRNVWNTLKGRWLGIKTQFYYRQ